MSINLNNCGKVSRTYFSESLMQNILASCESDAFNNTYHVDSINSLINNNISEYTDSDKAKVHNLIKNDYWWIQFKK